MPSLLPALIGGAGGAAAGLFPSKTSSGTSQTTTDYSPQQSSAQTDILSQLMAALGGGPGGAGMTAAFAPVEASGIDTINKGYGGLVDNMTKQLASRGFTQSGTTGLNLEKIGAQRAGDIGTFEGNLAGQKVGQYDTLLSDAMKAAYTPAGSQTANSSKEGSSPGYTGIMGLLAGLAGKSGSGSSGGGGSTPDLWGGG